MLLPIILSIYHKDTKDQLLSINKKKKLAQVGLSHNKPNIKLKKNPFNGSLRYEND